MTKDIALKAACADTFYYPPEWKPSSGTLDQFQRRRGFEHHLGKTRTKNVHKGILQIRFEMPFKVQCLRCLTYIGQGTRYDANKKKIGKYFTSSIYEFAMRCGVITSSKVSADGSAHCNQRFVIRTDPKNDDYELAEGLRRKVEMWTSESTEMIELPEPEAMGKMQKDALSRVEIRARDKDRQRSEKERMHDLVDVQDGREDDYILNCAVRKMHRVLRKEEKAKEEALRLQGPLNFALPLVAPMDGDLQQAKSIIFKTDHDKIALSARRAGVRAAPLFGNGIVRDTANSSSGLNKHVGSLHHRKRTAIEMHAYRNSELASKRCKLEQHAKMERRLKEISVQK